MDSLNLISTSIKNLLSKCTLLKLLKLQEFKCLNFSSINNDNVDDFLALLFYV